jgi:hypothetical protein
MDLPFLVVHGELVGKLATCGAFAAIYVAWPRRVPRPAAIVASALIVTVLVMLMTHAAVDGLGLDDIGLEDSPPVVVCPAHPNRPLPIEPFGPEAIAAATPARKLALDTLETELRCQYVQTPQTYELERAVAALARDL